MRGNKGFTLLEMAVALSLAVGVAALAYALLGAGGRFGTRSANQAVLHDGARVAMERIAGDLRAAGPVEILPDGVRLRKQVGLDGRRPRWSGWISYRLETGTLWRIERERSRVAGSVASFRVTREGGALRVRLEVRNGGESAVVEEVVEPRNER